MNTLDIVILAVVGLFTLLGLKKGFIVTLATLAGLFLGIYLAIHFSDYASGIIERNFHPSSCWLPALAYAATFLVVLIGIYLIGKLVENLVEKTGMGVLNHIGGALLGFAKGVLIMGAIFYLINLADPGGKMISPSSKEHAIFYQPVAKVVSLLIEKIPF